MLINRSQTNYSVMDNDQSFRGLKHGMLYRCYLFN